MNETATSLPLILAGPILRRTDVHHIALWLVSTQELELRLYLNGTHYHCSNGDGRLTNLKVGPHLYFSLLDIKLDKPLPQDQWLDYQLDLKTDEGDWQDIVDITPSLLYPGQSSLGFQLPGHIGSILHGSCRKPHHDSPDGLVEADRLIERLLQKQDHADEDLPSWPSALVLSGDQIYADDVAGPTLRAIHDVISALSCPAEGFSGLEAPAIQSSQDIYNHPDCYYGREEILPKVEGNRALMDMLFEGVHKPVFTTDTAHNHLITLHENLVMYLMVWSPVPWTLTQMSQPDGLSEENKTLFAKQKAILKQFVSGLEQVRRLFAHIPVAMIFDDHDVTDDWNLNRQWEEAVYNHPFSTRMIGNSLSAYFICQGWGNAPDKFSTDIITQLQDALEHPGHKQHDDFLHLLISFEGWEYDWQTTPPLIVIDSRTRRWRSESSMVKPSGLLDWEALGDLQQKLYGNDSVLLVSPAPIYGVKLIETIQRVFTWLGKPLMVDAENWMAHPGTANSILNVFLHSKTPQNFVILSGDVHYSFVYDVELRNRNGGPDIWQVTSSGLKNEFPKKLLNILDIVNRWLYAPQSPLNWLTKRRRMRVIPRKPEGHADGRRVLNGAGIGLVELDKDGKPWRFRQLLTDGTALAFHRMEKHSRWQ
ncbi:alkaline phosphatase family protein [Terasakiella sp. SH-1]|uniref:alkaline phosphatase family protein n=1 Tax=Terasakiella sp. SH-1 TaxID=2560057 RepID=UPI001072FAD1|nr:alkaline phosphatase family protein [Terasakiella sp. SH-1]